MILKLNDFKTRVHSKLTRKNIYIGICLLLIFAAAYYVRIQEMRFNEIPDIDTWFFYRLSENFLKTGQWITIDYMRNYPFGVDVGHTEFLMTVYLPVILYNLGAGWGTNFFHYFILFPAIRCHNQRNSF